MCVAHSPWRRTSSFRGSIASRRLPSNGTNWRWGNARSSGSTSSRTNWSTQSNFFWYSGSVSKSHAIGTLPRRSDQNMILAIENAIPASSGADESGPGRRRRPHRPPHPGQAGGRVRQRSAAPARCRARGHPPLRHGVAPTGGRHRRRGRAVQRRLLPALQVQGRPGRRPSSRTAASASAATWPTSWPRRRPPRARCGAGSRACCRRPTSDIAATTLAVLWNGGSAGAGLAAGRPLRQRAGGDRCSTSPSPRSAARHPTSTPSSPRTRRSACFRISCGSRAEPTAYRGRPRDRLLPGCRRALRRDGVSAPASPSRTLRGPSSEPASP